MTTAAAIAGRPGDSDLAPATVSHVRGSTLLLLGRVAALIINTAAQVIIVRYLSKSAFGTFAFALSVANLGQRVVSLGHGQCSSRFMALYLERRDFPRLYGTLVLAAGTIVTISVALFLLLFALRAPFSAHVSGGGGQMTLVLIMLVLAATDATDYLLENAFAVFARPRSIFYRKYLLTPGVRFVACLLVVFSHSTVTVLAVAYALTGLAGVGIYLWLLVEVLRQRGWLSEVRLRQVRLPFRSVFGFGLPLISTEVFNVVLNSIGIVLLGFIGGARDVADLRAILPIAATNQIVIYTFTTLFVPLASRLYVHSDTDAMRGAYWQTAGWLAVLSFPVFALTGPFAHTMSVGLFGQRYATSASALAILSLGFYANAVFGFNAATLLAFGRVRYLMTVNLVCAAVNIALYVLLIPPFGAEGVAAACCATLVLQNVLNQLGLKSAIGVAFLEARYVPVLAAVAVAGAVTWVFAATISVHLLVAFALSGLASLGVLAATRRHLHLEQAFPELRKVPVVHRLVG